MSILKLFLPKEYFNEDCPSTKYLYGVVKKSNKNLSVYISSVESTFTSKKSYPLGLLVPVNSSRRFSSEKYVSIRANNGCSTSEYPAIQLDCCHLLSGDSDFIQTIHIILYDLAVFSSLAKNEDRSLLMNDEPKSSIVDLLQALLIERVSQPGQTCQRILERIHGVCDLCPVFVKRVVTFLRPLVNIFAESAIYEHFSLWSQCIKSYSFRR